MMFSSTVIGIVWSFDKPLAIIAKATEKENSPKNAIRKRTKVINLSTSSGVQKKRSASNVGKFITFTVSRNKENNKPPYKSGARKAQRMGRGRSPLPFPLRFSPYLVHIGLMGQFMV